ncbi:MAG: ferrochelatase, partial [Candidatus Aminicenantales bacterium]
DPYFKSIHSHFRLLQNLLPQNSLFLAFQNRLGPIKWAGPEFNEVLYHIKDQGFKKLVIYPMSFTIDNYETSYEIDRYYRNDIIHKLNFSFKRIPYLNDSKDFISFIEKKIDEGKWLELA